MAKSKSVLGKGLEALIPSLAEDRAYQERRETPGAGERAVLEIAIEAIRPNPFQPREDFDAESLAELTASIRAHGMVQPVTVRRTAEGYELIAGERRLRAARAAGMTRVPAYVRAVESDTEMLELALIENVQRAHLNPMEVATGYQRLIDDCHLTQEEVAGRVSKDRATVANTLRLLKLPAEIQASIRREELSAGHARALAGLAAREQQIVIWKRVVGEGLSVRATETLVRKASAATSAPAPKRARLRAQAPAGTSPAFTAVASRLRSILATQVHVRDAGDGKGEIVVEFYSAAELERLLELLESIPTV